MAPASDKQWDVIVVGCGYAGAIAAIAAHDSGARVLILEKMPDAGGISICSAGGLRITFDRDLAFAYLKETNRNTTPDDVLIALANGMETLADRLGELAQATGATVEIRQADANYAFEGYQSFGFATISTLTGTGPSGVGIKGAQDGYRLFAMLEQAIVQRGIDLRMNAPVTGLLRDETGRVAGVTARQDGVDQRLFANGGIILACGGFEANQDMQRQYWNGTSMRNAAFLGNTGDGIKMAQSVGADLWHMWHFHGTYGFHHTDPDYPLAIRTKRYPDWTPGDPPGVDVKMPWILLDQSGQRFMNEYDPYLQDTGARPFGHFDPQSQSFPRIPAWLIADEPGRMRTAFGRPVHHLAGVEFDWSPDNLNEVAQGILHRAETLDALADILGVGEPMLNATLERWNSQCIAGADTDHKRPANSMMPISQPPFYAAKIWPLVNNTQGGPVHDAHQRVLDPQGLPICGLYAAGELGSAFGFLYLSGGNLAECFIGGDIAGKHAAAQSRGIEQ